MAATVVTDREWTLRVLDEWLLKKYFKLLYAFSALAVHHQDEIPEKNQLKGGKIYFDSVSDVSVL